MLDILYKDEHLIAINKPHGLLVHRTGMAADAKEFALQLLRDQLGRTVYPAHRIDRKTGGVLLFALSQEVNSHMQKQFAANQVDKIYHAIVRGNMPEHGIIDYPLKNDQGKVQDAITVYKCLKNCEIPLPFGKFKTSRYSFVEIYPKSGRNHQIRKHFAHIMHPVIGDRPHGCNKQNGLFKSKWDMTTMLLHAYEIQFDHPVTKSRVSISATYQSEFNRMLVLLFNHIAEVDDLNVSK